MDAKTQYWVAPDGTKHPLNPDQLQDLMQSTTIANSSSAPPQQRQQGPVAAPPPGLGVTKQTSSRDYGSTSAAAATVADIDGERHLDDLDREMLRDAETSDSQNDDEGSGSDESESDEDEDENHPSAHHNHHQDLHYSKGDSKQVVEREISDDAELDNDVAWIPRGIPPPAYSESDRLPVGIAIVEISPFGFHFEKEVACRNQLIDADCGHSRFLCSSHKYMLESNIHFLVHGHRSSEVAASKNKNFSSSWTI